MSLASSAAYEISMREQPGAVGSEVTDSTRPTSSDGRLPAGSRASGTSTVCSTAMRRASSAASPGPTGAR